MLGKFIILGRHFVMLGIYTMSSLHVLLYWWKFRHIESYLQDIWLHIMPLRSYYRVFTWFQRNQKSYFQCRHLHITEKGVRLYNLVLSTELTM